MRTCVVRPMKPAGPNATPRNVSPFPPSTVARRNVVPSVVAHANAASGPKRDPTVLYRPPTTTAWPVASAATLVTNTPLDFGNALVVVQRYVGGIGTVGPARTGGDSLEPAVAAGLSAGLALGMLVCAAALVAAISAETRTPDR